MNTPTSHNATNGPIWNRWDLSTILVNLAAGTATMSSYLAIVGFAQVVLKMNAPMAYTLSGVFELAMLALALKARKAVREARPHLFLSILTMAMAVASGLFAGWEEIHLGHPFAAAVFRFLVAITGAALWEISLVGDKHIAAGISWREARQYRRMQAVQEAAEDWGRARDLGYSPRRLRHYERAYIRARRRARRIVTPHEMTEHTQAQEASANATVNHLVHTLNGQERERAALDGRIPARPTQRRTVNATPTVAAPSPVAQVEAATTTDDAPAVLVAVASETNPRTQVTTPVPGAGYPTGPGAACWGCGKLIEAHRTPRARYCDKNSNGEKSQACKGIYQGGSGFHSKVA